MTWVSAFYKVELKRKLDEVEERRKKKLAVLCALAHYLPGMSQDYALKAETASMYLFCFIFTSSNHEVVLWLV